MPKVRVKAVAAFVVVVGFGCSSAPQRASVAVPSTVVDRADLKFLIESSSSRVTRCADADVIRRAGQACDLIAPQVLVVRESDRKPGTVEVYVRADRNEYLVLFSRESGQWHASELWLVDEYGRSAAPN